MPEPSDPIRTSNGIEMPIEEWIDLLLDRFAQKMRREIESALIRHESICPARRFFWISAGAVATGVIAVAVLFLRVLMGG